MKRWFISDTHFSHNNIIKYASRPYETVEEMNRCLIDNWNLCVEAEDLVFFLGDFGLGDVEHLHSICSQLKGHKICIRGNWYGLITRWSLVQVQLAPLFQPKQSQALKQLVLDSKYHFGLIFLAYGAITVQRVATLSTASIQPK